MTRSRRRLIAWFGILGIAFAQFAVTAHACTISAGERAAVLEHSQHGHCAGEQHAAAPLAPPGNACEVQCTDGALSAAAADLPAIALLPMAVTPTPVSVSVDHREWDRSVLAANSAAPPPLLQYCRFLN